MSNTTKSVDDELRSIIGEMPSYIFEYLELSDELKREWKHGSAASDFGGHKNFVNHFEKRITQLFVKQLEEAGIRARIDEQEMTSSDPDGAIDVGDVTKESWWSSQESRIEYLKAKLAKGGTDDTPRV